MESSTASLTLLSCSGREAATALSTRLLQWRKVLLRRHCRTRTLDKNSWPPRRRKIQHQDQNQSLATPKNNHKLLFIINLWFFLSLLFIYLFIFTYSWHMFISVLDFRPHVMFVIGLWTCFDRKAKPRFWIRLLVLINVNVFIFIWIILLKQVMILKTLI